MSTRLRQVRALGPLVLVALAMNGFAAQVARAAPEFTSIETTIVGEKHESGFLLKSLISGETTQAHRFSPSSDPKLGFKATCTTSTLSATMEPGSDKQMTATVGYGGCGAAVDMKINGCDYTYKVESKVEVDLYKGSLEIGCAAGKSIEIETTSGGKRQCLDTIPAQAGIGPIYYRDMTEGSPTDLTIVEEAENVRNITDNGFLACLGLSPGEQKDGYFFGETTVKASNAGGAQVDFEVGG